MVETLAELLKADEAIVPFIFSMSLGEILLRLMMQFPGHTFLQGAVVKFIVQALQKEKLRDRVTNLLLEPLLFEGRMGGDPALRSAAVAVVGEAVRIAGNDKGYRRFLFGRPRFEQFFEKWMKPRMKVVREGYGGCVPFRAVPAVWTPTG
jgi:hypothetical protein